jgi:glucose/arabinose dehydrogenase
MRARVRIAIDPAAVFVAAACLGLLALALASQARAAVGLQPVGTFNSPIYATAPPGDPRLFVVERGGTIQVLHDGTRSQFLDIHGLVDSNPATERGLLSMAFDPNYASNGLFYVFFNDNGTAGGTDGDIRIEEFRVSADPNAADLASRRTVLTFQHSATNHNGGQLQFGPDGLLYASVGDNANGANAQTLANFYGKILRIDPHGAGNGDHGIPATNPFTGGPTPEIWSLGLRNPFRFSFDYLTGDLVIGDVGASTREEIDFSPSAAGGGIGANYGWPNCEGFLGTCPGAVAPVFDYTHSGGACAIIGGFVYRGNQVPELAGRYLYTDLCTGNLRSIALGLPLASDDRSEGQTLSGPNSFGQDSSCELYVTSGNVLDKIVSTTPPATTPACPAAKSSPPPGPTACSCPKRAAKKCKKRRHKKRAAEAKKHKKHKKRCKKKRKKKHRR